MQVGEEGHLGRTEASLVEFSKDEHGEVEEEAEGKERFRKIFRPLACTYLN